MSRRTLVFGDDGSEAADVAWLWVNEHTWPDWQIEVVTVDSEAPIRGALGSERTQLHPWSPPSPRVLLAAQGRTEVSHLTCEGDPRAVLNRLGYAHLMVIGHRGHGLLKAVSLGSTADWLLKGPPAPLIVIRSARPTRRVLLYVDGSVDALDAARVLAALPWIAGVEVVVLSVDDGSTRLLAAIEAAQALLRAAGAATEPMTRESLGHPSSFNLRSTILGVIDHECVDLVALGARGLAHSVLRGSIAAAVTHHAVCSVLVARGDVDGDKRQEP